MTTDLWREALFANSRHNRSSSRSPAHTICLSRVTRVSYPFTSTDYVETTKTLVSWDAVDEITRGPSPQSSSQDERL